MFFILTTVGEAAVLASPTPPVLSAYSFGSGFNYTPVSSQTALNGTAVYSGTPALPVAAGPNLLRYTVVVDSTVGNFSYGELGLYLPGGQLFAIGAQSALTYKNTGNGNNLVIDCYVPVVGANYNAYTSIANSAIALNVLAAGSIDSLPQASLAQTNIFIVPSRVNPNVASLVASVVNGLWSLQGYNDYASSGAATSSGTTVTVSSWTTPAPATPSFAGQLVLQSKDGPNAGSLRVIQSISGNTITLENPFSTGLQAGNTFEIKAFTPTLAQLGTKQDALRDATGAPLAGNSEVPTVTQLTSLIATAIASLPAGNITGLATAMTTVSVGNSAFPRLTNAFGQAIVRALPT